eukprot:11605575-Alexandrium_andersonii.AAC.1
MSASLVGSEMCIRDRAVQTTARSDKELKVRRAVPVLAQRSPSVGSFPVSYTHLTLPTICSV